jgi:serine/threonine protein phosphatase 1
LGGEVTHRAYQALLPEQRTRNLRQFFSPQRPYFEDEAGNLYVHGGYDPALPINKQHPY